MPFSTVKTRTSDEEHGFYKEGPTITLIFINFVLKTMKKKSMKTFCFAKIFDRDNIDCFLKSRGYCCCLFAL